MSRVILLFVVLTIASTAVSACSRQEDTDPPLLATPEITLDRAEAPVASPLEMTYRFALLPTTTLAKDYTVFVHFLDADSEIMWTDDHVPPVPTSQWKAGTPVEYSRTMFAPKFPYEGKTYVEVGLYDPSTGERVKMEGESPGQRAYRVAAFDLRLKSDAPFIVFTEGWHDAEVSTEGSGIEWQWTRAVGTLAFKNPMRDAVLYLQLDQPVADYGASKVDVAVGPTVVDSFEVSRGGSRVIRKIAISKGQFGTAETVTLTITPDQTLVPASVPALRNGDTRELGVRVFRAYLQPRS